MEVLRKLSILSLIITTVSIFAFAPLLTGIYSNSLIVNAQGGSLLDPECDPESDPDKDCTPPTLRQFEYIIVRLLYFIWAFGGIVWLLYLLRIGYFLYMNNGEADRFDEARRMAVRWLLSFFLLFLSRPLVATVMNEIIGNSTNCFADLRDPGFTFFFAEVCTEGDGTGGPPAGITVTPGGPSVPPPTPAGPTPLGTLTCTAENLNQTSCAGSWANWDAICASQCSSGLNVLCLHNSSNLIYIANCNCATNTCSNVSAHSP